MSRPSLMRPFANPLIGEKILSSRGGKDHELIDKNQGLRPILRAMNEGRIILDIQGEEKKQLTIELLMDAFANASGETFVNDRMLLS